jgi:hypothetical protein
MPRKAVPHDFDGGKITVSKAVEITGRCNSTFDKRLADGETMQQIIDSMRDKEIKNGYIDTDSFAVNLPALKWNYPTQRVM